MQFYRLKRERKVKEDNQEKIYEDSTDILVMEDDAYDYLVRYGRRNEIHTEKLEISFYVTESALAPTKSFKLIPLRNLQKELYSVKVDAQPDEEV